MLRSWQFSPFIKLLKILEKLKLTSFVDCSSYIMMIILCWYYSAVIMPDKEEFVDQMVLKNCAYEELVYSRFIIILFGFQVTEKCVFIYLFILFMKVLIFISILFGFRETEK
ncbi:hypothetical protein ACB092_01G417600 [Castanea dentata]